MTTGQAYAVGDKVTARRALVAPPIASWGVGVEIQPGTRGEIVNAADTRYLACFEVGTAFLEIGVDRDDIELLHPEIPRFEPEQPDEFSVMASAHVTCRATHASLNTLMVLGLVGSAILQPLRVGIVMVAVLVFIAGCFWWERYRRPAPLLFPGEHVARNKRWVRWAVFSDIVTNGCALMFATVLCFQYLSPDHLSRYPVFGSGPLYATVVVFAVAWLFKEEAHRLANGIVRD